MTRAADYMTLLAKLSKTDLNNALKNLPTQEFVKLFDEVDMGAIFKKLDVGQKISLIKNLDESDKLKILNKLDSADQTALLKNLDLSEESLALAKADKLAKANTMSTADKIALVGSIAGIGAFIYLDDKAASEAKKVKQCMGNCLPSNWDEYEYGSLEKDKLTYRTLESFNTEFPDEKADPSQPFCAKTIENCGTYCSTKCKDLHETALPGESLFDRTVDEAVEIVDKVNPFKLLFGDMGGFSWLPLVLIIVFFFIFMIMS